MTDLSPEQDPVMTLRATVDKPEGRWGELMGVVETHVSEVEGAYRLRRDAKMNSEDTPDSDLEVR